jgi:hypothetical protein
MCTSVFAKAISTFRLACRGARQLAALEPELPEFCAAFLANSGGGITNECRNNT